MRTLQLNKELMSKAEYKDKDQQHDHWDQLFTRDVIEHYMGEREGGLGQWEYSEPRFDGDPVDGAALWIKFLENHPEYYVLAAEIKLAAEAAENLPKHISEPVALAFLGPGNKYAFKRKDLTVTKFFNKVATATAYDLSTKYISEALKKLEEVRMHADLGGLRRDIFQKFDIPVGASTKAKKLATMFGLTLFNTDIERDSNFDLIIPEKAIKQRLKNIHSSVGKGGFFVTTQDANDNKEKIENAYKGQTEFAVNLAHRIKRDTPYKKIDTENVDFQAKYHEDSHILAHYLTANFNDNGNTDPTTLLINSSPKIPLDVFTSWCKEEGFESAEYIEHNGVYLHVLEAI